MQSINKQEDSTVIVLKLSDFNLESMTYIEEFLKDSKILKPEIQFFSSSECSFMEIIARPGFRNDLGRPTSSPIENKKCFMHSIQE